jgi:hypothetical protein
MSTHRIALTALACCTFAAFLGSAVHAQTGFATTAAGATPSFRAPGSYQRLSGRDNPALRYFGGSKALAYSSAGRSRPMPAPQPVQTAAVVKPFSGVQPASAVTPYLALDERESTTGLPNYYLFVKPQLDQQARNQIQQAQYRRLQQQMRMATAGGVVSRSLSGGMPTTGHSTQFMNNGGYYPGLR